MKALSVLILAAVPATLGIGAIYWLTFSEGTHTFSRQLSREKRDAMAVRAVPEPVSKLKIVTHSVGALRIENVDQDGTRIVAYVRNSGHVCVPFVELHYKVVAPDGTIIDAGREDQPDYTTGLDAGSRIEISLDGISEDNRASSIEVWATGSIFRS